MAGQEVRIPTEEPAPPRLLRNIARYEENPTLLTALANQIQALLAAVTNDGNARMAGWSAVSPGSSYQASAANLACYLAVRSHDLRALQRSLTALGLSSLGRLESRVLPTLSAVNATLQALTGRRVLPPTPASLFYAGENELIARTHEMFGSPAMTRPVALMVTAPTEAADDPSFMLELATRAVEAVRINCAHDDADAWARMIAHLRSAEHSTGHRIKIFMDLAGPKIRTGEVRHPDGHKRIMRDDLLVLVPEGGLRHIPFQATHFGAECTLPEALVAADVGQRVFVDDGKLGAVIERVEHWGLAARVTTAEAEGLKLKPEKGLNFPDTALGIAALTPKDRNDLDFVAAHADGIEFSFVQSAADVIALQTALAERRPFDWQGLTLVLKIETALAVRNLPDIVVQAAGHQPTAIMIARGDLAVEIGFARTAEMQEEILWIGEAARVPVIWATQVLEHLVQTGTPLRGEMTDAAMAARAECVMLNKGPFLLDAIDQLGALLGRMEANQHKKSPQLRRLESWLPHGQVKAAG